MDDTGLKWSGKAEWGYPGQVYTAEAAGWRYHVGQARKGLWCLRGWGPGGEFLYREYVLLKYARAGALAHLRHQEQLRGC